MTSSTKDFQIISKLGDGAYSQVFKVKRISDGVVYALKKVKMSNLTEKEKENALTEVRILASIDHPNIVGYKEAFFEDQSNSLCLIMEYAELGDLSDMIKEHKRKGAYISESEIWSIFIQTVKGLQALHALKIFHRDLKSANVFLYNDGRAKLGDLNVSKVAKKGLLYTQTGTPYYASPEVWRDKPYDSKSDIWSLGCVLYEATTLKPPFQADSMQGLYKRVLKGIYPKVAPQYSQNLANLIKWMLQTSAISRPSTEEIMKHKMIMEKIDEYNLLSKLESNAHRSDLLGTIQLPKNLRVLSTRLPKSKYQARVDEEPHNNRSSFVDRKAAKALSEHRGMDKKNALSLDNYEIPEEEEYSNNNQRGQGKYNAGNGVKSNKLRRDYSQPQRPMRYMQNNRIVDKYDRGLGIANRVAQDLKLPQLYQRVGIQGTNSLISPDHKPPKINPLKKEKVVGQVDLDTDKSRGLRKNQSKKQLGYESPGKEREEDSPRLKGGVGKKITRLNRQGNPVSGNIGHGGSPVGQYPSEEYNKNIIRSNNYKYMQNQYYNNYIPTEHPHPNPNPKPYSHEIQQVNSAQNLELSPGGIRGMAHPSNPIAGYKARYESKNQGAPNRGNPLHVHLGVGNSNSVPTGGVYDTSHEGVMDTPKGASYGRKPNMHVNPLNDMYIRKKNHIEHIEHIHAISPQPPRLAYQPPPFIYPPKAPLNREGGRPPRFKPAWWG